MDRLRPGRYEAQPRSSSSGSHSSAGTSSSRGAHTPSTSPSLSDTGDAAWNEHDHSADGSGGGSSSSGGAAPKLSPLEMLMQRGKQVQHEILRPEVDAAHSGKSKIYERATALSRKTSVKQKPYQPSPDPDDFDDAQSVRSINLAGSDTGTFSRVSGRRLNGGGRDAGVGSPSSQWRSAKELGYAGDGGDQSGPRRFAAAETSPSGGPSRRSWQQRQSGHLLGNAFRDSVASDISFNSITGQVEEDQDALYRANSSRGGGPGAEIYSPDLMRRDSVDTVRSSEFGEHGRWGRAWANKAEDEESVYEESTYGGDDDDEAGPWRPERYSLMDQDVMIEPGQGSSPFDFRGGSKLDNITSQWKASRQQAGDVSDAQTTIQQQRQMRQRQQQLQQEQREPPSPIPQIHSAPAKEHIVNLTRSAAGPASSTGNGSLVIPGGGAGQSHRHSFVPSIYEADLDAEPGSRDTIIARSANETPLASSQRQLGHRPNDSTSTLGSGDARVYVYPPSPSGSEASRGSGGVRGAGRAAIPPSSSAVVETMESSPESAMAAYAKGHLLHHAEAKPAGPVAPSTLLARSHDSPSVGQISQRPRTSGHPAGRPPPPTPTEQSSFSPAGYADPNRQSNGPGSRPVLGRARSEAVAAANGRESIVSDLDVETLRLDGSSRRDSTSTIGSIATSRMSVGTVRYEDIGLPVTAEERDAEDGGVAPSKAAWDPTARLRSTDLPSPRRALTSPTESGNDRQPSPSRSNTHPMQEIALPGAGQQWGAPASAGVPGNAGYFSGAPGTSGNTSLDAGFHRAMPATAAPPLRQAKSSAAIPTMGSASNAAGAPSSAAMKPSNSAFSDSSALTSQSRSSKTSQQGTDTRTGPSAAEDFLSQGITYHEQGDLSRSAFYFERSARVDGGCVVGMCMFGMALREGWGARKDPRKGFEWIQRAAAKAGEMMQAGGAVKSESEIKAIKSELKLSVYELGKCFCYGWGVKMDKSMALEYFELAARLGDADAQAEAGALYASGKGCKKDLKKAAMYYRLAEKGGYDTVGLSWIHKDKYK